MGQRAIVLDGALLGLLELLELAASAGSGIATDQASKTRSGSEAAIPSWLTRALALFDGSDSMNMGPGEFARLAHRTPEHVNRTMQVVFGCDTTTRLNAHRMQRAGRLLRMSALPISDVAQACGFASLTHFYRCFNAHYQNTPRQYRLAVTRPISRRA
jgi:transcriptional regulator GlxA family with amidase domain